jgi:putative transposase
VRKPQRFSISKSQVSKLCEELDAEVEQFRNRPLKGSYPCVLLEATYLKGRQDGQVVSMAVVMTVGDADFQHFSAPR